MRFVTIIAFSLVLINFPANASRKIYTALHVPQQMFNSDSPSTENVHISCRIINPSDKDQHITIFAYNGDDAADLYTGFRLLPMIPAFPSAPNNLLRKLDTLTNKMDSYTVHFTRDSTPAEGRITGIPLGITIEVQEDEGFLAANCQAFYQSSGEFNYSYLVNGGRPF